MRRVTVVPFGPWVTTVSTGSLVIWRLIAVWAWAAAAAETSAKPAAIVPMGLIAKPPCSGQAMPQRPAGGRVPGATASGAAGGARDTRYLATAWWARRFTPS